ncbi:MAG: tetratricopeptide repeat protein, partial [Roseiarcus sp.]
SMAVIATRMGERKISLEAIMQKRPAKGAPSTDIAPVVLITHAPDQPLVLTYLGYSWVDQGVNLDEAFKMLRRAVDLRPSDGYIVDSLGWAYYKLGHYQEATDELEKAIDLKPADPVVNDHLGDAYWRVNRRTEAHFQWNHARDMGPEPEDLPKILHKIEFGLPDEPSKDESAAPLAPATPAAPEQKSGG